jgi:hypothetical protein
MDCIPRRVTVEKYLDISEQASRANGSNQKTSDHFAMTFLSPSWRFAQTGVAEHLEFMRRMVITASPIATT